MDEFKRIDEKRRAMRKIYRKYLSRIRKIDKLLRTDDLDLYKPDSLHDSNVSIEVKYKDGTKEKFDVQPAYFKEGLLNFRNWMAKELRLGEGYEGDEACWMDDNYELMIT
jgi:hypothetical protein